jgi:uncharacterized protein involved in response to NO|tara:strand:+ start:344 stop:1552 length:1209 start_codon:yes stop_codon:yes gene_type:complete
MRKLFRIAGLKSAAMPKPYNSSFFQPALLELGFRPFFFLGALYSLISLLVWGGFYAGQIVPPAFLIDPVSWHIHEMIYGFTVAIIAGFLLTAVVNWTGCAPIKQRQLAALCLLWLVGRIVINIDLGLPFWLILILETSFIPVLLIVLAIPLIRANNTRNFLILLRLLVLFACDVWFLKTGSKMPLYIALMMVLTMVSLIGGRIIPAFTVGALRRTGIVVNQTAQMTLDRVAVASLIAVTVCLIFVPETRLLSLCALFSAIVHGLRMRHYHSLKTASDPMLWILHLGYGWLVIGLILLALTGVGVFEIPVVIHALTAGCIGSMTLGMMTRVTLGHTGRPLESSTLTTLSFVLMQIAVAIRILGPMLIPQATVHWIIWSAGLWTTCFVIYLFVYAPMLFKPRAD